MTPAQKKKTRNSISSNCAYAVANEPRIHYSQQRPFPLIDQIGVGWHTLDCSGWVINNFWNASHDLKLYIADPSGMKFSGWGNTWTIESWLREHGKRVVEANGYLVGDIVRWGQGEHSHTAICSKSGSARTADWTSHGREGGPNYVKLGYRSDLVGVWRHPALL
jgi:hypothetical protein